MQQRLTLLGAVLADLSRDERLGRFRSEIDGKLIFTTSFGLEDQVILHLLAERNIDVDIVTLDTGRPFSQTYEVWAETERRYGKRIRAFYAQQQALEVLIEGHGRLLRFPKSSFGMLWYPESGTARSCARWRGGQDCRT